ncbi:hypothetical protein M752DRAFT_264524 [Aspergillus phoenicis ATCC 13157]|uniref:Uncharacterized protein n=1 Tax=Aspergillus phoenicis ATCC 13157 TaxID=1353007 RepID=A0A370PR33_ASPPH|nr:hypothetical protein M752DRAFT_264524 [Aspergillus phoenicis ATCC 13157]
MRRTISYLGRVRMLVALVALLMVCGETCFWNYFIVTIIDVGIKDQVRHRPIVFWTISDWVVVGANSVIFVEHIMLTHVVKNPYIETYATYTKRWHSRRDTLPTAV